MRKFISDKGLNYLIENHIPIKRYKIHTKKIEKSKIKKGLVSVVNNGKPLSREK
jgi:hypothetical protein